MDQNTKNRLVGVIVVFVFELLFVEGELAFLVETQPQLLQ